MLDGECKDGLFQITNRIMPFPRAAGNEEHAFITQLTIVYVRILEASSSLIVGLVLKGYDGTSVSLKFSGMVSMSHANAERLLGCEINLSHVILFKPDEIQTTEKLCKYYCING